MYHTLHCFLFCLERRGNCFFVERSRGPATKLVVLLGFLSCLYCRLAPGPNHVWKLAQVILLPISPKVVHLLISPFLQFSSSFLKTGGDLAQKLSFLFSWVLWGICVLLLGSCSLSWFAYIIYPLFYSCQLVYWFSKSYPTLEVLVWVCDHTGYPYVDK